MPSSEELQRHLKDLCRRAEKTGSYVYSAFLTPAEQSDFEKDPPACGIGWSFWGGTEGAERRLLICGSERDFGYAAEPPAVILRIRPVSEKFSEDLTHRDYLGSLLSLGVERSMIGDILIRDKEAYAVCLDGIADYLCGALERVRRTGVRAERVSADIPALAPRFETLRLNLASERLDALISAFCGLSRGHVQPLFAAERVFVDGRVIKDGSRRIKEGETVSVRGFGKAVYDGILGETKKGRLTVSLRRYC